VNKEKSLLCVANWDSNVGYAWWLMESFWAEIARNFNDKYRIVLAYPSVSQIPKVIEMSNIDVKKFNFGKEGVKGWFQTLRFIRKEKIQVIYFSDKPAFSLNYFFYRVIGVKKIIVHDHTPGERKAPEGFKKAVKCLRARLPWVNVDAVIGATDFVKYRNIKVGCVRKEKCYSAPNGIPMDFGEGDIRADLKEMFGIRKNRRIIISVGRANFYKGIDFALYVINRLVNTKGMRNIHYIHVGDGPDMDKFKKLSRQLELDEHVTFAGRQTDVSNMLKQCDIAIHPSKGEVGYSLSIIECMKIGLPVVVPDNPSVCSATLDHVTGMIYKDGDLSSASNGVLTLLRDDVLRNKISRCSKKIAAEKYSIEACHEKFNTIITEILDS